MPFSWIQLRKYTIDASLFIHLKRYSFTLYHTVETWGFQDDYLDELGLRMHALFKMG